MSLNTDIAELFKTTAVILEIKGESNFRVNANLKVAEVLQTLVEDISTLNDLTSLPGVGKSSATKIQEYIKTGHIKEYEELLESIPTGLLDLLKIQGLGPKTVKRFWEEANITDMQSLKKAIEDGTLLKLPRMGAKTVDNIKDSLNFLNTTANRTKIGVALPIAKKCISILEQLENVINIQYAGSLRRGQETIGDIDILVSGTEPVKIADCFCQMPDVTKVLAKGETKCSVRVKDGIQVDLRIVDEIHYGAALAYFTGSKNHNITLRERAIKMGMRLNEYGLFKADEKGDNLESDFKNKKPIVSTTEELIYKKLNLEWIPPEIRENQNECDVKIPKLIQDSDIVCDLHCHTTASDGYMTIQQLADEAKKRGYHTVAITDHSQSSAQANGLSPERLEKHIEAIRTANDEMPGINLLAGSEVDIMPDGSLDYDDALLQQLDIVVASPHSSLNQSKEDATTRLIKAISHPLVHIIGHPTGRIIQKRKGLEPDMIELFNAAIEYDTVLEINANFFRIDLRDTHIYSAAKRGVRFAINTDAHHFEDFDQLQYGILAAKRGWLTSSQCINCMSSNELNSWLRKKRC